MSGSKFDFGELLARSRAGDRSAADDVFQRWRPLLTLQARRELAAEVAAQVDPSDIVQEALLQAYSALEQFRGHTEGEWVAWLQTQVAGHAAKVNRRYLTQKRDVGRSQPFSDSLATAAVPGPTDLVLQREEALRIANALEQLPNRMREVIVRRVFAREPFEAVARALDCSPGAARVLWTRALRRLRELLDETSD